VKKYNNSSDYGLNAIIKTAKKAKMGDEIINFPLIWKLYILTGSTGQKFSPNMEKFTLIQHRMLPTY